MVTNCQCLGREAAAQVLGCSLRMVDKLRALGELPSVAVGRRRMFLVRDIEAFLKARRTAK